MRTVATCLIWSGLLALSGAAAQGGFMEPFTATYAFTTAGPTDCGANENPDPVVDTDYPPGAGLEAFPVERTAALGCDDAVDDAFGTTGFGASYDDERRLTFGVVCNCILIHYIDQADLSLSLWRSSDGPTSVRILRTWGPGGTAYDTLEVAVGETPSFVSWPSGGGGVGAFFLVEAAGGTPDGALYLDDVLIGGVIVPVELTHFDALADGSSVTLRWGTASETNNAGFEVQVRAVEEAAWSARGFVPGHGTTTEAQAYQFTVPGLSPGRYAFRLKQIDYDGGFEYSEAVEAVVALPEPGASGYWLTDVHPHPLAHSARLSLAVARSQHVEVVLVDGLGRRLVTVFEGALSAHQTRTLPIERGRLPAGRYALQVRGETFRAARPVVVIR